MSTRGAHERQPLTRNLSAHSQGSHQGSIEITSIVRATKPRDLVRSADRDLVPMTPVDVQWISLGINALAATAPGPVDHIQCLAAAPGDTPYSKADS